MAITFIGPAADTMKSFSQKHTARALAESVGVPVLPGTPLLLNAEDAVVASRVIGLPVLLKVRNASEHWQPGAMPVVSGTQGSPVQYVESLVVAAFLGMIMMMMPVGNDVCDSEVRCAVQLCCEVS